MFLICFFNENQEIISVHTANIMTEVMLFNGQGQEITNKIIIEESVLNDVNLDSILDSVQKEEYIKKWYKVENGQLVKRSISFIKNVIELTTTAIDTVQPFDGIPDVPADGTTPAVINVVVKNPDTGEIDTTANDILYVETTRGKLSTVNVQLVNGQGSFEIRCSETVVAEIRVWHPQNKYREGRIKIQFRPV